MKQEYVLIVILAFFGLGWLLTNLVQPLDLALPTPYHYLDPAYFSKYPFSTTSIALTALALFISPLWFLSFVDGMKTAKGVLFLVAGGLLQLYALQDVASGSHQLTLEWDIALTLAGLLLLPTTVLYLILGIFSGIFSSLLDNPYQDVDEQSDQPKKPTKSKPKKD